MYNNSNNKKKKILRLVQRPVKVLQNREKIFNKKIYNFYNKKQNQLLYKNVFSVLNIFLFLYILKGQERVRIL